MSQTLKCREIFSECDCEIRAESEEEIVRAAYAHAKECHGVDEISAEFARRVRDAIREDSIVTPLIAKHHP